MARLVTSDLASVTEVAQVFGVHRNTVARIAKQTEAGGARAVLPHKPGPKKRHKVTAKVLQVLRQAVESGQSTYEAAREVRRRTGVELSHGHVWGLMDQLKRERPQTVPMDLEVDADPPQPPVPAEEEALTAEQPPEEPGVETSVPKGAPGSPVLDLPPGEAVRSRYLGLALFYPALQVVGLLAVVGQLYRFGGAMQFGVREFFLQLFCLALLEAPTIERTKRLLRGDLGPLIGCGRAACVKTLRRKLEAISSQRQAVALGIGLARRWLEVGLLNASHLYVDGHMTVYSGKRALPEVWNSQRRMPLPGIMQYFVNDLQGRPLLVVSEEVSGNLAKSLPKVVATVRKVLEHPFTVIFDRGGYDGKLFTWLTEQELHFITYQRGAVHLPVEAFDEQEVCWEGRSVRFSLAEDTVRVQDSGPWRRLVLRTEDGHQTPILTSLDATVPAAQVTALMLARWRQENFFKYARAHLGLDALTSSLTEPAADREVPNPAVKAAKVELSRLRAQAQKLRATLGQMLVRDSQQTSPADPDPAKQKPGRSSAKAAKAREAAIAELQALDAQIEQARARMRALPPRVALSTLPGPQETIQLEPKLVTEVVKVAAYNAQAWLAQLLARHYPHRGDLYDLLRSFAHLSGTITRQADGTIRICLDPPDIPLCRRALDGLCQELNRLHPVFPGTPTPVIYEVAMHHSSDAA
jgi:transposase